MILAETLESWLASRRAWLLDHGPALLSLDPAHERLVPDSDGLYGLAIEIDGRDRIPIFGLPPRQDNISGTTELDEIKCDLAAIAYDRPVDLVHYALDTLAYHRAARTRGETQRGSGFIRIPAVLPHFVKKVANGAELSYARALSSFSHVRSGAVGWDKEGRFSDLGNSINRDRPGFFLACDGKTVDVNCIWLTCERDAYLNLCAYRGQRGWRCASLVIECNLPQTITTAMIGQSLKSLVSYCLTDPFYLEIVAIQRFVPATAIVFSGAEQIRRHHTLFEDPTLARPCASEASKLENARWVMVSNLTMGLLPEKWWQSFRETSRKPGAPVISLGTPLHTNRQWVE